MSLSESDRLFHAAAAVQTDERPLYSLSDDNEAHLADHDDVTASRVHTNIDRVLKQPSLSITAGINYAAAT